MPPLRERAEDIPLLVEHFVADFALEYGKRAKTVTPAAMARLKMYRWPGNVRELRNVIERVVIMAPDDEITDRDLAFLAGDSLAEKPVDDPRRRRCRCTPRATSSSAITSCASSRISKAISRGRRKCWASSEAISIER